MKCRAESFKACASQKEGTEKAIGVIDAEGTALRATNIEIGKMGWCCRRVNTHGRLGPSIGKTSSLCRAGAPA
jgi:hypothetical protein